MSERYKDEMIKDRRGRWALFKRRTPPFEVALDL